MRILGVSCHYHDAAAALLSDGLLVAAAEEERFSRKKHDSGFPERAIAFCLGHAGIRGADLDYAVFYEKPLVKFERLLLGAIATAPRSWRMFGEAMIQAFREKLWIKSALVRRLGIPPERVLFADHHASHAASAFFSSPFEEAAILTVDGVGEWTTATIGRGTADWTGKGRNRIELLQEMRYPHSLGLLYSAFTAHLGFEVNEGEYKVMGMAPYGEPRRLDDVHKVARLSADGSLELDLDYFSFHHSATRTFSRRFTDLFGPPREPEREFFTTATHPGKRPDGWSDAAAAENQRFADLAASIQRFTEEAILRMAAAARERTGLDCLALAGGVALNSAANGRLLRESKFREIFIQPAAGDAGGALGAALYAYHVALGKPRRFVMERADWGAEYSEAEMERAIRTAGLPFERIDDSERLLDRAAEALAAGKVLGWFQGRFEWGPRALGNRSILADPRRADMKDRVNRIIKFREPFRPFAPAVLESAAAEYFTAPLLDRASPYRFMLAVSPFREGMGERVPAVRHEGGTGRVQTVRREWNPLYHRVIEKFAEATGVPMLLNTSFNRRGEPMAASPEDALRTFAGSGLDGLVMGPFWLEKRDERR